jgi:hypothetical protein
MKKIFFVLILLLSACAQNQFKLVHNGKYKENDVVKIHHEEELMIEKEPSTIFTEHEETLVYQSEPETITSEIVVESDIENDNIEFEKKDAIQRLKNFQEKHLPDIPEAKEYVELTENYLAKDDWLWSRRFKVGVTFTIIGSLAILLATFVNIAYHTTSSSTDSSIAAAAVDDLANFVYIIFGVILAAVGFIFLLFGIKTLRSCKEEIQLHRKYKKKK